MVAYQDRGDVFEKYEGAHSFSLEYKGQLQNVESPLISRLVEALKRGETAEFSVHADMFNNEEEVDSFKDSVLPTQISGYDKTKNLYLLVSLGAIVKVEDWYKEGSTLVKTIRKGGKGRSPYSDSTIKSKYSSLSNLSVYRS